MKGLVLALIIALLAIATGCAKPSARAADTLQPTIAISLPTVIPTDPMPFPATMATATTTATATTSATSTPAPTNTSTPTPTSTPIPNPSATEVMKPDSQATAQNKPMATATTTFRVPATATPIPGEKAEVIPELQGKIAGTYTFSLMPEVNTILVNYAIQNPDPKFVPKYFEVEFWLTSAGRKPYLLSIFKLPPGIKFPVGRPGGMPLRIDWKFTNTGIPEDAKTNPSAWKIEMKIQKAEFE